MTLQDALMSIAARRAAQLQNNGLRVPLVPDALDKLKQDRPEFFISGIRQPIPDQLSQSRPIRTNNRLLQGDQLLAELVN